VDITFVKDKFRPVLLKNRNQRTFKAGQISNFFYHQIFVVPALSDIIIVGYVKPIL
jgi:hypothetical protein